MFSDSFFHTYEIYTCRNIYIYTNIKHIYIYLTIKILCIIFIVWKKNRKYPIISYKDIHLLKKNQGWDMQSFTKYSGVDKMKNCYIIHYIMYNTLSPMGTSIIAQSVKNLPAMQEIWVWFLGHKDPLEKEIATHFSILAWRIPWTEESGRLHCMGLQGSDTTYQLNHNFKKKII